ncbi:MAG: hypothetical protein WC159_01485 [Sphaerochaetaceae bacterium]
MATVIAVGEGTDKVKMTIKAGDKILHDKFAGVQVKSEGEEYLILKMEDVLAVIC